MQGDLFSNQSLKNKYEEIFAEAYHALNPEQKKAVDNIEGTILVNAGPGTGKTQILALRIGKILQETDVAPHNILCLTYTDSATVAMRNRLVQIIGPAGHQVHIYTFHGFCNQVIQENLDIFGSYRSLEPINDLERVDVYREIIDQIPDDNILKRFKSDKYYEAIRLRNLFDLMKKENISPDEFLTTIDQYLKEQKESDTFITKRKTTLKNGKVYEKGDFRDDKYGAFAQKFEETKSAIRQFDALNQVLDKKERYDFHDMILWVLKAFRENEFLLLQYQERYQYFLVDEYQDTNGAQNDILSMLISYWEQPNVFVVGDDDQAIYKFQGANLGNIVDFKNKYQPYIITLTDNYRSNQNILDAAKGLIEFNQERLINSEPGLSKDLFAKGTHAFDNTEVKMLSFDKLSSEITWLARTLESEYVNHPETFNDIAVIYRKHRQVEELVKVLEFRNIPINIKRRVNILELPMIKNILTLLKYLESEYKKYGSGDAYIFELMHFAFWNNDPIDIGKLALYCQKKDDNGVYPVWRDVINDQKKLSALDLHNPDSISSMSNRLNKWILEIPNITLQSLFENILNEGEILRYIMEQNDRAWYLQSVNTFFDYLKDESARNPEISLSDLLSLFKKMAENDITLDINKIISSENGVNFITAHSAKGQEYQKVFLIGCTKNVWDKSRSPRNQYKYPDAINADSQGNIEDERRLFYVAMTRAKTDLMISFSQASKDGKPLGASQFIDEVVAASGIESQTVIVNEDDLAQFYFNLLVKHENQIPLIDPDLINHWFEGYRLSVTHLNKYLRCPLTFYFEAVLRVPHARNAPAGFGSAMHDALHYFFMEYKKTKEKNIDRLHFYFEESMKNYKSHFTADEFESYSSHGKMTLDKLLEEKSDSWFKANDYALEEELSHAEYRGYPIKGFLDKVEIYKDHVHVVDYKTGKFRSDKLKGPNEKDPNGGDYWRQLVFYKMLLISDKKHNWNMTSGEIDFVEPDRKTGAFANHIYHVSEEDIALVGNQIEDTFEKIKSHQFDKTCGEDDCYWCNFVQDNYRLNPQLKDHEHSYDS